MKIQLENRFHNTTTYILVKPGGIVTARQIYTAHLRMCGVEGCQCNDLERVVNANLDDNGDGTFTVDVLP
jgi:hypothetical protein